MQDQSIKQFSQQSSLELSLSKTYDFLSAVHFRFTPLAIFENSAKYELSRRFIPFNDSIINLSQKFNFHSQ